MLKRIFLILVLSLCAPAAWAAHCNLTLANSCTEATPCDYNDANAWSDDAACGGNVAPVNGANTFTFTIPAGLSATVITSGNVVGSFGQANPGGTVNGTLTIAAPTSGDAYNSFTVNPSSNASGNFSLAIATTGRVVVGKSNRLLTDTTSAISKVDMPTGARLIVEGETCTAKITAVYGPTHNDTACGTGASTENQYYVVEVDGCLDLAKAGRRMQWENGDFRNQAVEIVNYDATASDIVNDACTGAGAPVIPGLPAAFCTGAGTSTAITASPVGGIPKSRGAIGFCTWRADGTSGTLGQRLTGHIAIGNFAAVDHWVPTMAGNDICTGANAPEPWCTGVQLGTGWRIFPHVGDSVTVIDDAVLGVSAGTNVFAWNGALKTVFPTLQAFHTIGARLSFQSSGNPATDVVRDVEYGNMHDSQQGGAALIASGWQNQTFRKMIVHDFTAGSGIGGGLWHQVWQSNDTGPAPNNSGTEDSVFYRLSGDASIWTSSGVTLTGTGCFFRRNLYYASCTRDDECNAIEVDHCRFGDISDNLAFDYVPLSSGVDSGGCYRATTDHSQANDNQGVVYYRNICVNAFGWCIKNEGPGVTHENAAATGNYCANLGKGGIQAGGAYGNFVRNYGLQNPPTAFTFGLNQPLKAYGNFILTQDDIVESGFCNGIGGCQGTHGIKTGDGNTPTAVISVSDNVFRGGSLTGNRIAASVGGGQSGNVTIDHLTADMVGKTPTSAVYLGSWAPTINTRVDIRDLAVTHANDGKAGDCPITPDPEARVFFGTYTGNRSPTASERISDAGPIGTTANCNGSVGTRVNAGTVGLGFKDRTRLDYGYVKGASLASAGAFPVGSALGSRAWRFNRDGFIWAFPWDLSAGDPTGETTTPFPANFSNGTCSRVAFCNQDLDGDSVIDIWDNCPRDKNPSQYDADGDGRGNACDAS